MCNVLDNAFDGSWYNFSPWIAAQVSSGALLCKGILTRHWCQTSGISLLTLFHSLRSAVTLFHFTESSFERALIATLASEFFLHLSRWDFQSLFWQSLFYIEQVECACGQNRAISHTIMSTSAAGANAEVVWCAEAKLALQCQRVHRIGRNERVRFVWHWGCLQAQKHLRRLLIRTNCVAIHFRLFACAKMWPLLKLTPSYDRQRQSASMLGSDVNLGSVKITNIVKSFVIFPAYNLATV